MGEVLLNTSLYTKSIASLLLIISAVSVSNAAQKPLLQLASNYRQDIEISEYFVSEKLDGVRARWTGTQLISRNGYVFNAPRWFIDKFPASPLDGELWIERNRFDEVSGIVRQKRKDNQRWRQVKFMVFDLPRSALPFTRRLATLKSMISHSKSPYLKLIEQRRLNNKASLNRWLNTIVAVKGEGLMLHKASALYQTKRSSDLMKLKKVYDADAMVIEHIAGRGKYKGMLGAVVVETSDGVRFKVGSGFSDEMRRTPPKLGSIITYKYYGLTKNGIPRFASFLRMRNVDKK